MGLQSAMTTALTGLQASETAIDVIGNNIANSNTVGFKTSEVVFATQFLRTQSIGSAPSDASGGSNPRQIGLGVKVAQISPDFSQGTVEISSSQLDLAIQGDGFLVVQGSQGEPLYTRNGQLGLNSENQIVTTGGQKLLGYAANENFELDKSQTVPLEIPIGAERVAQATANANFAGVLNPTVEVATTPEVITSEVLGDGSIQRPTDSPVGTASFNSAPAPGTATESGSTGGGLTSSSTYQYRVAWKDANGEETSVSSPWSVTLTAAGDTIDLSGLPNAGAEFSEYAIYRTEADGNAFFKVADSSTGTTATPITTFTDTVADTALGTALVDETIDNGTFSYYVTYYNPSSGGVESLPSEVIGPVAASDSTGSVRLDLSTLTQPTDANFTSVRIYRNLSGDPGEFRLLDTIPSSTVGNTDSSYIDKAISSSISSNDEIDFNGPRALGGTFLVDLVTREGSAYPNLFEEGTLSFKGSQGGSTLDSKEFELTANSTVQDLLEFMRDSLGLQDSSNVVDDPLPIGGGDIQINTDGQIVVTSNFGEQNAVDISLSAFSLQPTGSETSGSIPIVFSQTQEANGPGTTSEFLVYDSLGSPLSVRMTTVLESFTSDSTTYRWYASSGDSDPTAPDLSTVVGNGTMVFDSSGDLISSPSSTISVFREATASQSPLEIDLDFSSVTALAETNAAGDPISSFSMTSQDGFPPGVLTDFIITESGLIQGQFSNGTQRTLGQVVMARFANNQGLSQVGDSLFSSSVNSGEAFFADPGTNGLGSLTAGAVELSNTDIGQDLVKMILAQTQYQAGSRVISAAQELLDELLALQR